METLVLLYFLYLEKGTVGQGETTILALSRYMRMSKTKMKDWLAHLQKLGYINAVEKFGRKNYKRWHISMTDAGQQFMEDNYTATIEAYRKHVAETIMLINERNSGKYSDKPKISKKQKKQVDAGQKELF